MKTPAETNPDQPTLVGLLYRHCLTPDGKSSFAARGLIANLRKLRSPATRNQGLFALGSIGFTDWERDPSSVTVTAVFASHPHSPDKPRNFGTTCRDLATRGKGGENSGTPGDSPFDRHFRRLLAARTLDDILPVVLSIGRIAKSADVSIDYYLLHKDLRRFRYEPDAVLERWAQSYFKTLEPAGEKPIS
jgi:CRISPR type I-E-associated protein CasB/Cse2